jgi:hypothetical protein
MSIAYVIRAYHRPRQLARLVGRLQSEQARFYVHVSARTSEKTYDAMREELAGFDNVVWTRRMATFYGGYSLLQAQLVALEAATADEPVADHTLSLSGQDYPLMPAAQIEAHYAARRGKSTFLHYALPSDDWPSENGGLDRIRYFWFERVRYRSRLLRLPLVRRRFPAGLTPYGGAAWCALSADALRYVIRFTRENPRVLRFFRYVMYPEEIYIPTVLMNSPHAGDVINETVHYVDWSSGGAHPKLLGREDVPRLLESGKPFGRKFDMKVDAEVLDVLDREATRAEVR